MKIFLDKARVASHGLLGGRQKNLSVKVSQEKAQQAGVGAPRDQSAPKLPAELLVEVVRHTDDFDDDLETLQALRLASKALRCAVDFVHPDLLDRSVDGVKHAYLARKSSKLKKEEKVLLRAACELNFPVCRLTPAIWRGSTRLLRKRLSFNRLSLAAIAPGYKIVRHFQQSVRCPA